MSYQVVVMNPYPFGGRAEYMMRYREWWTGLREWLVESQFPYEVTACHKQNEFGRVRRESTTFHFGYRSHAMLFKLLWGTYDRG